ncbi:TetR/AcrR family transcriptional regulator [Brevibacterium aurantiacum]|uniref:TetR/AcrR family transcriptional regulator n=1 Tax=Brevibacterium aurantiacum TaxID=273384 RepID=UPI00186608BA|nr:TetR/AcrR family transcriptional regulator [Brevibacterium aurantiacum]
MASKDTSGDEIGLALTKLWGTVPRTRRGPKPKLTLQTVVDAAVSIARDNGLAAVSMAGVAEVAGCAKMALYRHVSDRDDLLAAMVDTALGEPPTLDGSWHERFTALWESLLALYARDPWMLDLPADIETLTPQNAAWIDAGLCLFETSTLPHGERLGAVLLLTENARFVARQHRSEDQPADDLDRLLSSVSSATTLVSHERYPHLAAVAGHHQASQPITLSPERVRETMARAIAPYFPTEAS